MANRTVFVDLGDAHGPLGTDETGAPVAPGTDVLVNDAGLKYLVQGSPQGLIYHYATLAAAMSDTANLVDGQYVFIAGGDNQSTGIPNADRGIWRVAANQGAAYADYTKVLDGHNTASEIYVEDTAGFYGSTDVEAALAEIGTKQIFFKLGGASLTNITVNGGSSAAADTALKALVIDNGTATDAVGAGAATVSGIILNGAYPYKVPLVDTATHDTINDGSNNDVYARLTQTGGNYVLTFYSWKNGVETPYTFASAQAIDIGYVMVSQDFMKLPAYAGVVQGEFFGDASGATGTISDSQITCAGPFTGLLVGLSTQQAVNAKVDELGLATAGMGASLIAIEDAGNLITATTVEGALAELAGSITGRVKNYANLAAAIAAAPHALDTYVIITGAGADAAERGVWKVTANDGSIAGDYTKVLDISHTAAEVLVADAGSLFATDNVEAALTELLQAIGGTSTAVRDYSSNVYVNDNDSLVVAIGKLDAALGAMLTDRVVTKNLTANEAINAATNGPRLVEADGTAFKVNLAVVGSVGPKVDAVGFATGADYAANAAINSGDGVVLSGICTGFTGLAPGAQYFADPASPGSITSTVPNVVGQWVLPVGIALSPTVLLVRIGEAVEIISSLPPQQLGLHKRDTSAGANGIGEAGYSVSQYDIWVDADATVQNPTKSGNTRVTMYICKQAWVGAGLAISAAQIRQYFVAVGTQG